MKDPRRIDRILLKIKELWAMYPDQRLGQLLTNHLDKRFEFAWSYEDEIWEELTNCAIKNCRKERGMR